MADQFVVLRKNIKSFRTVAEADAEKQRIEAIMVGKRFRVARIKSNLMRSKAGDRCIQLDSAIRRALGTLSPNSAAAKILRHELERQPDEQPRKVA